MPISVEFIQNNDPRIAGSFPVLDLYLNDLADGFKKDPCLIIPYLSRLPNFNWLNDSHAHILLEERIDMDLDNMVVICYAMVSDEDRVFHSLANTSLVPMMWQSQTGDQ